MKKILLFASAVAMLASCSKDLTEDVAPSIQGNTRIIASLEADSNVDTRSHLENRSAYWDLGDALGVFAATSGDKTNAYFGYNGTEFVGDLYMVKGESIYAYYPWTSGKALSAKKLSLTIPGTQYYNHKYAASFAAGTVPAVGIATVEDKDADIEVNLQPVASYIGIPIKGMGTVGSVTLKMYLGSEAEAEEAEVKYETPVTLNGSVTVDFATPDEENGTDFTITNPANTTATYQTITLQCGDGVELSRTDAKTFVFVVPAYIDFTNGVKFEVTVKDMDGKNAQTYAPIYTGAQLAAYNPLPRNMFLNVGSANIVWNEGGKLLIDNEEQFVKYAYLATYGWAEAFDSVEDKAVAAALAAEKETYFNGAALREATLMADLEFKGDLWFEKDLKESEKKALNPFEAAIYEAYNVGGTNPAITSIGGKKFSINGNKHSISGLNFNGSIFADTQTATSTVSDLKLVNATVTADYFMASSNAVKGLTLTNVTTGEGCQLIPETEGQGAFYNTFNTSSGAPVYETLPTFAEGGESIKYANTLTVTKPASAATPFFVALDAATALEGEMNIKTADYNAIKTATAGTLYVIAKTDDTSVANVAKALIENDVIGYSATAAWHSVVERDAKGKVTRSYWTGKAPTSMPADDGIFTAEELACLVSKRTVTDEQTLTCNLTLTYKPWEVTSTTLETPISIDGAKYTITGAQIKAKNTNAYNYSIFGYEASLKNLTVTSTTIDLTAYTVNKNAKVAVLATKPGEKGISGVTVNAPTIRMNAASSGVETVGGMFAEVSSVNEWELINGENNKITTNTNATRYLANGAKFGSVVGKLTFDAEETETELDYAKTVTTDAVNKIIGVVDSTNAPENTEAHFADFGEGQYPSLDTVLPTNGTDFSKTVYVYNGTEKASFFWFPTQKAWVVTAE